MGFGDTIIQIFGTKYGPRWGIPQNKATAPATIAATRATGPTTSPLAALVPVVVAPALLELVPLVDPVDVLEVVFLDSDWVAGAVLPNDTRFAVKRPVALSWLDILSVPSHSVYHFTPHSVPLRLPVHDFAAPTAEPCSRGMISDAV